MYVTVGIVFHNSRNEGDSLYFPLQSTDGFGKVRYKKEEGRKDKGLTTEENSKIKTKLLKEIKKSHTNDYYLRESKQKIRFL